MPLRYHLNVENLEILPASTLNWRLEDQIDRDPNRCTMNMIGLHVVLSPDLSHDLVGILQYHTSKNGTYRTSQSVYRSRLGVVGSVATWTEIEQCLKYDLIHEHVPNGISLILSHVCSIPPAQVLRLASSNLCPSIRWSWGFSYEQMHTRVLRRT